MTGKPLGGRFAPLLFGLLSVLSGCAGAGEENQEVIHEAVLEKQLAQGRQLNSYRILNEIDSPRSVTIMVEIVYDSVQKYRDTLRFGLTEDGIMTR